MTDLINTGLAWLNDKLTSHASQTYTYRRGLDSVDLAVTIGKAKINPLSQLAGVLADRDAAQPSAKHSDHRFSFAAADLTLGEPQEGDTLEVTADGVTTLYILASPLDGGPAWSYTDGHELRITWNGRLKSIT